MDFIIQNSVYSNTYNTQSVSKNMSSLEGYSDETQVNNNRVEQHQPANEQTANIILEQNIKLLQPTNTELQYSIHEKTKQIMISIINSDTKEVLREIPPEKNLDAYVKMLELAGLTLDIKI